MNTVWRVAESMASRPADTTPLFEHWQHLALREKCSQLDGYQSAEVKRQQLTLLQCGIHDKVLSHGAASYLHRIYGDQYATAVDSPLEMGGVNNYAESALVIQAARKNDSKQWTTSLTRDRLATLPCVQSFINVSKLAEATVVPPGKENTPLHLCETEQSQSARDPAHHKPSPSNPAMSSAPRPGDQLMSSTRGPETNKAQNVSSRGMSDTNNKRAGEHLSDRQSVHPLDRQISEPSVKNRRPLFSAQGNSNTNPYAAFASSNPPMPPYRKPEQSKRSFREVEEDDREEESPFAGGAFRTAREQFAIDQQKKNNRSRGAGGQSCGQSSAQMGAGVYGSSKRSLGTRRGLSSKFVPPIMNRDDEEDDGGTLVRKTMGALGGSRKPSEADEPVDERLKNIDPKMIELVTNEIMDHGPPMTWSDIAGLEFAKKTIKEIVVWPMLRPDIFTGLRGPPKGLLLFGPPGTGKTLIGKCIACQSKSTFFSISASSLTSKWVGEGEKMVRALFAVARVNQPAVIFIDEIDSLLSQRTDGEHESSRRIKTEFLVQLDGASTSSEDRILVVGATNRPQELDEAARRRFVKRLYIPLPEEAARAQIIHNLMSSQAHELTGAEIQDICQKTQGYSGADMANLCREAALGPIRTMSLDDIENISADQVRAIIARDFASALLQVRASVSEKDLDLYIDWNKQYGSWEL